MMSLNMGCRNCRDPPRPQTAWGRWPLVHGHRGHRGHRHTQRDTHGALQCHLSSYTPGRSLGAGTHTAATAGAGDKGGENIPRTPRVTPELGLGLTAGGSLLLELVGLCRRNGSIHTPRLPLALGTAWVFPGEHLLLSVSPRHHGGGDALTRPRRMCQHQRECAEELTPPSSPRSSTKDPAQPLLPI